LPESTTNALFIKAAQQEDITTIQELLEAEETFFGQQNASLYMLQKQNRQLGQRVQQLELLYRAAQQEIGNQVSHNQILRSFSQATALQNYYNNEYEVLPLWFKRLGHIIKVIMGKRSFKSLFSDNAKKYKD
jgi:dihydrofolate reductase